MLVRPLEEQDLPTRVKWMNDERIFSSMKLSLPITLETTKEWYIKAKYNERRHDLTVTAEDGTILAFAGIVNIDPQIKKAETYIFVNPDSKGRGIGSEAKQKVIDYGFGTLDLHKLYFITNASNQASQKMNAKLGYKLEGRLREEKVTEQGYEDRLYYGLLRDDKPNHWKLTLPLLLESMKLVDRNIYIIRDDIFPFIGGGSKARKALYYESYMIREGLNACVTTGGIQSNHNRAIALMCARNGWKCHIVFHGTKDRFLSEKGNAQLVRNSGATFEFVEANEISVAMDNALLRLGDEGYKPMYVHGGGHDIPGGMAFVEAVIDLKRTCDQKGIKPKYIFLACGTGSTQAGIRVGLDYIGWSDVEVIGISVARKNPRATKVVEDFANELASSLGMSQRYNGRIFVNTDYLAGGYEQSTITMQQFIDSAMLQTGIMFDTTYSGKALYGMYEIINKQKINGPVIFWHTGGLMNIMK